MRDFASDHAEDLDVEPDSIAVLDSDDKLSYAELHSWLNELGCKIIHAIGTEPKVCLVVAGLDRLGIVGMTAVLKTPHIFLAVDREIPSRNIAQPTFLLSLGITTPCFDCNTQQTEPPIDWATNRLTATCGCARLPREGTTERPSRRSHKRTTRR